MIPQIQHRNPIISSGNFIVKPILIDMDNSEHIFGMLSEMYSDPIKTICREPATNGIDSMRNANTLETHKLEVTLPTRLDLNFRVRDYGTGLSEEEVDIVFRMTGKSTKRECADSNGTLGIGSKSPYSYAQSWMVVSFYEGRKITYQCYKDEKGLPQIVLLSNTQTDEHNGVEIVIPVKSGDISSFQVAAKDIYPYFNPAPIVHNQSEYYSMTRAKGIFEGEGWSIGGNTRNNSVAIMSNVAYPIDYDKVIVYPTDEEKAAGVKGGDINRLLAQSAIELDFVNGSLQFTPSRESLNYTPFTKVNLTLEIEKVAAVIEDKIITTFEDKDNIWEAKKHYRKLFNEMGYLGSSLSRMLKGQIKWNDITIDNDYFKNNVDGVTVTYYDINNNGNIRRKTTPSIMAKDNEYVIINDVTDAKNGATSRIKKFLEDNNKAEGCYLVSFDSFAAKTEFYDKTAFDTVPCMMLSDMEKMPVVRRATNPNKVVNGKHNLSCFTFKNDSSYISINSNAWEVASVDFKNGNGMWVKVDRFEAIRADGKNLSPNVLREMITYLEKLGVTVPVIHGIKSAMLEKKELGNGWVNFFDWAKKEIEKVVLKENFAQKIANRDSMNHNYNNDYRYLNDYEPKLMKTSVLKKFMTVVKEMTLDNSEKEKISEINRVANLSGLILTDTAKPTYELDELKKEVEDTYPLFAPLSRGYSMDSCSEIIFDYVNMVDKMREEQQ